MSKKKVSPQWTIVESSHMEAVAYDKNEMKMLIRFKNGAEYKYYDVPQKEFDDMLNASSQGEYFHRHIKNAYECVRIN